MKPLAASWALDRPLELVANTAFTRTGGMDPTGFVRDGRVWRASRHGSGPAALCMWIAGTSLRAEAWGAGAEDALLGVPALSGLSDDASGFEPWRHPVVHEASRRRPGLALVRTNAVFDAAVRAVLAQKVTGLQAKRSFQALARRCGERAPLPVVERRPLLLPPTPEQ
ncbi:MAG: hypothetical protein QOJ00_2427, partial [Actinomycetota bacterium]